MNLLLTAVFVVCAYGLGRLLGGKSSPKILPPAPSDVVSPDKPGVPHVVGPAPDFVTAEKVAQGLAQAHPGEIFIARTAGSPVAGFRFEVVGRTLTTFSAGDCAALIAQGRL